MTPDGPILGLPLHPLVVHLVVIALPVGAFAVLAAVLWPSFRTRYGFLSVGTLTIGALAAVVARVSGEALAETEGLPERHAAFGSSLVVASLSTAAIAWAWLWLERRREQAPPGRTSLAAMVAAALTVTACLATAGLTALTGHTGADAVWGTGRAGAATPAAQASGRAPMPGAAAASETGQPGTAQAQASGTYTMVDVAQHADAASCWAAIDGGVYDLTDWIDQHPGGPQRIRAICGTDATAQFRAQHSTAPHPSQHLAEHRIGSLG